MREEPSGRAAEPPIDKAELAWVRGHLDVLRRTAAGEEILYWHLGSAVAVGLAAQIAGYLLRPSPVTEPLGLLADLLYVFGLSLWTGVVVTIFVQVLPERKRREISRALVRYEQALREQDEPDAGAAGGGRDD